MDLEREQGQTFIYIIKSNLLMSILIKQIRWSQGQSGKKMIVIVKYEVVLASLLQNVDIFAIETK